MFLESLIEPDLDFAHLKIPLALQTTDLGGGVEVALSEGSVLEATMATSAFPGVFPPVEKDGMTLIDGGLLNNVPVNLVRNMGATTVIAVDVLPGTENAVPGVFPAEFSHLPEFLKNTYQAAMMMISRMSASRLELEKPDILLRPAIPLDVGVFASFSRAEELIEHGVRSAEEALPELMKAIGRQSLDL